MYDTVWKRCFGVRYVKRITKGSGADDECSGFSPQKSSSHGREISKSGVKRADKKHADNRYNCMETWHKQISQSIPLKYCLYQFPVQKVSKEIEEGLEPNVLPWKQKILFSWSYLSCFIIVPNFTRF